MPKFLVPRRHGPHRAAAIALYRALLRQTSALALEQEEYGALLNVIRNKFKDNCSLTSERLLKHAFTAGYRAIDHLDAAATGDEGSLTFLGDILSKASLRLQQPVQNRSSRTKTLATAAERPFHTGPSVLDRPLPKEKLKGVRRVPKFVSANNIPFLRFKKPQPRNLSLLISHRIKKRDKRLVHEEKAREMIEISKWEDQWDHIVRNGFEVGSLPAQKDVAEEPKWQDEWKNQLWMWRRLRDEEKVKNAILAAKMHDVVVQEQELADEEAKERLLQEAQPKDATNAISISGVGTS